MVTLLPGRAQFIFTRSEVPLPLAFCWSKFGIEAGESTRSILERKEVERQRNDGVFLWGIGTSIRPSLRVLLDSTPSPRVVFTPMLSRPAERDSSPSAVVLWNTATDLDGCPYELPRHSLITSSKPGWNRNRHFAGLSVGVIVL